MDANIDIICLQEVFLKQDNVYRLPGYNLSEETELGREVVWCSSYQTGSSTRYISRLSTSNVSQATSTLQPAHSTLSTSTCHPGAPSHVHLKTKNAAIIVGVMIGRNQLWGADTLTVFMGRVYGPSVNKGVIFDTRVHEP